MGDSYEFPDECRFYVSINVDHDHLRRGNLLLQRTSSYFGRIGRDQGRRPEVEKGGAELQDDSAANRLVGSGPETDLRTLGQDVERSHQKFLGMRHVQQNKVALGNFLEADFLLSGQRIVRMDRDMPRHLAKGRGAAGLMGADVVGHDDVHRAVT